MSGRTLREELEEVRAELARLRQAQAAPEPQAQPGAASDAGPPAGGMGDQMAELNRLVHQMLEEAEETITEHPVATVAGALALGIVIGRLTSR